MTARPRVATPKPPKPAGPRSKKAEPADPAEIARAREVAAYMTRSCQSFHNQKKRAAAAGQWVTFTLDEFRTVVKAALARGFCPYCGCKLLAANFSADHKRPVSRTGSWELCNVEIICHDCNKAKGPLDAVEFRQLMQVLAEWSPAVRLHTLARLKAGGQAIKSAPPRPEPPTARPGQGALQRKDGRNAKPTGGEPDRSPLAQRGTQSRTPQV